MAYSTNPNLPKARAIAMKLLVLEQLPVNVVANRCGVHRSTIWRWKCKWLALNKNVQLTNNNRPSRIVSTSSNSFRRSALKWNITTISSKPHHHPWELGPEVVQAILTTRQQLKRCAEVVWYYVNKVLDIVVSLSSVRRVLKRHHCFDGARKKRVRSDNPKRPWVKQPGDLVQIDTIHHLSPRTNKRLYYYTVIDLYTRMAYVIVSTKLSPGLAVRTILEASNYFGFKFKLIQTDNGPEFSSYFEQRLKQHSIAIRHTRLGRPNDNAHIERFNRTIQEECIGHYWLKQQTVQNQTQVLTKYLDYYNHKRVHLSLQLQTPSQMLQRF